MRRKLLYLWEEWGWLPFILLLITGVMFVADSRHKAKVAQAREMEAVRAVQLWEVSCSDGFQGLVQNLRHLPGIQTYHANLCWTGEMVILPGTMCRFTAVQK